ncbi:FmdB family zinc ribbon protein [Pseudonocardia sp. T1-2H]|uniref:FmdB family zinc ribbon protein n=1 Tax=Pseudonocardia sp. T1-2H TaxID=3128899 RepID=UPI0040546726
MARYQYLCRECGPWIVVLPMGTAEAARRCPACGGRSKRQWTAPSLNLMDRRLGRLRRREEAGRDVPEVTTAVPPAARRRPATDPRHVTLPRP